MKFLYIKFNSFSEIQNDEIFIEIKTINYIEVQFLCVDESGEKGYSMNLDSKDFYISGVLGQYVDIERFLDNDEIICPVVIQGILTNKP